MSHGLGLVDLVRGLAPAQRRAGLPLGTQLDARGRGPLQQGVGRLDHLRCRAVVADQLDARGAGEPAGEPGQVGRLRTGEGVDRLGRVPDHAELVAPAEPQVEERGLDRADVLVFVHDEPLVLAAHLGGDPLVLAQQRGTDSSTSSMSIRPWSRLSSS